ncbi:MAG: hypothetical protein PF480_01135 [Roseovarius sp.]|nr:hypothetical protein [Roseovarius sp.]
MAAVNHPQDLVGTFNVSGACQPAGQNRPKIKPQVPWQGGKVALNCLKVDRAVIWQSLVGQGRPECGRSIAPQLTGKQRPLRRMAVIKNDRHFSKNIRIGGVYFDKVQDLPGFVSKPEIGIKARQVQGNNRIRRVKFAQKAPA